MRTSLKISERLHYAFLLMTALASVHERNIWLNLNQIAEYFRLSQGYLEEIVAPLRKHKLVKSRRGGKGGYRLAKAPQRIDYQSIVRAIEGPTEIMQCESCFLHLDCITEPVWQEMQNMIATYLSKKTLRDTLAHPKYSSIAKIFLPS
ncbi:MAG: hypothetical protein A3B74_05155 [Candidatus Kerfeldbacteria bacterium RIFCSPHIGHO2_02_FULL_42_14]|uniref:Rrf2 family transcriptional regulator n=1 Tax=Candidatus Kerfeldbacteria bacterium RIFCSPHIGHO2_02_FULL_42_14 TaxID=1798540 RepID=A0A1G2ATL2_9BACT|nr:MAG: hypothetical protein A3B74_05155 [Candidatus Kerfeldbacteria bacterium RIFCSPHIGHO2_02_FULL_42_14]OGY81616.1 MAG: hypothetical protein A3E60_02100 [Candidatus Kerfeldbacteria bacterium RIFCSPHIGHO2_12_FULL_42_13]OGY83218.1 MAG: hypothetical protein A3I91_03505 [Candidatus Kerfeldbacteria bacterium RIFCSPLOWO2_02_FULL_42_19]OGY85523.1 MAG: hypothetical protein A3G01_01495 [Candidatus Kerfeldbacteria bacterium RIFCSPLOWO2_12_FULL_43_9]